MLRRRRIYPLTIYDSIRFERGSPLDSRHSPGNAFQITFTAPVSADFLRNRAPLYHPSSVNRVVRIPFYFSFLSFLFFFLLLSISNKIERRSCRSLSAAIYVFPLMEAIAKVSIP